MFDRQKPADASLFERDVASIRAAHETLKIATIAPDKMKELIEKIEFVALTIDAGKAPKNYDNEMIHKTLDLLNSVADQLRPAIAEAKQAIEKDIASQLAEQPTRTRR